MSAPINPSSNRDIWHSSIDDLLAPLPETPRLGGAGPFVVNLSASTAPISVPVNDIAGCRQAHLYLVQRMEDGRMRYRLRLGPFAREDDADAVLVKVRDLYPSALTATAGADDLRSIAAMQAKADALRPSMEKQPEVAAVTPAPAAATAVLTTAASSPGPSAANPLNRAPPKAIATPSPPSSQVLQLRTPPLPQEPVRRSPTSSKASPARVPPATPAATAATHSTPAAASLAKPALRAAVPKATQEAAGVTAFAPRHAEKNGDPPLSLEATQTLRPLTPLELEDEGSMRWFVIQLSVAEQAFDPDTVPNLDIFIVYRLYSVAALEQGRTMHALRLGFFGEEMAARAVANYLAAYYDKPTIKRVSVAERERFSDRRIEARKDVGATGQHMAIEITSDRVVRQNRSRAST
jgi:hypothetical protein